MHILTKFLALMVTVSLFWTSHASAQISEIRAGISDFDEQTIGVGWALEFADENSVGINADIVFEEPKILKWALSPQPYIGGMINLEGKTSYGGAGLIWRQNIGSKLYGDLSVGLAVHNGTLDIKLDNLTRDNVDSIIERFQTEIEFGSRVLFRPQIAVGYRVSDDWAGELFFEHLSHARLFDSNDNDGVDIVGVRAARKF